MSGFFCTIDLSTYVTQLDTFFAKFLFGFLSNEVKPACMTRHLKKKRYRRLRGDD
jgi:hypothetical protein